MLRWLTLIVLAALLFLAPSSFAAAAADVVRQPLELHGDFKSIDHAAGRIGVRLSSYQSNQGQRLHDAKATRTSLLAVPTPSATVTPTATQSTTSVIRLAGIDRYTTAATISKSRFGGGATTVFIATGATFPDALAGVPAAAKANAPILLTASRSLPKATANEITRLGPSRIVVLGGAGAVSDTVVAELKRHTSNVIRWHGADRYATAAKISSSSFGTGVGVAYVATAKTFPDALAGGAVAGKLGGPILLVDTNAVPVVTATELNRLKPARIVVLGGRGVISDSVTSALGRYTGSVSRLAGADRYETSVQISRSAYGAGSHTAFVATGADFPDGLAGGPVAALLPGPLLLVSPNRLPDNVERELQRLKASNVIVLGGSAVISDRVLGAIQNALPSPTPSVSTSARYVSTSGSDANPGTIAAPYRTVGHGLKVLSPGDTLFVRGGTYIENIKSPPIQPGQPDARVRVAAYPGERPVIQGLLWLKGASYWTVDGINVTWSTSNKQTDHMVKMTDGVGWEFLNAELWGARSFSGLLVVGTVTGQPSNWVVRGNCIHDVWTDPIHHVNGDHNLYINTGTSAGPGLVERNVLFNAPNGQNIKLGFGRSDPQPGDGAANVTVRYNTMYSALKNVLLADETHHITLERNIIQTSKDRYAIRAYRLTGQHNVLRDNVFHDFSRLQYADAGYGTVTDGGGNLFPLDPQFNSIGCGQFLPQSGVARLYGHAE